MTVYQLSKDVETLLHSKNFPLRVHFGPERAHREGYPDNVIIVERSTSNDSVTPPRGIQRNPRKEGTRNLGGVLHIYARSSRAGSHVGTHTDLCEKYVDAVLIALRHWAVSNRAVSDGNTGLPITESRYLSSDERLQMARVHAPQGADSKLFQAAEQWPGVVYRIVFTLPRALLDLNYQGDGEPEGTLTGVGSMTLVTGPGGSGTGCGG